MKIEELINELQDVINEAKVLPLSGGKVVVDTEKVLDILDDIQDTLPLEVRQAKNIVADRGQIISEAKKEAEDIVRAAEERKKAMIKQSEIVHQATLQANEILADAKAKTAEMRKAANEYVDNMMRKADEALSEQLAELKKTRQNIKQSQRTGN